MTKRAQVELEINGIAPDLAGKVCEALICEQYFCDGKLVSPANVTFIKLAGYWHRLCIDCGIIFWREQQDEPQPWSVPEKRWDYPHVDVAAVAGVLGATLSSYEMSSTTNGSKVQFKFDNGRQIVIDSPDDVTGYIVI